jgi:hypothetical protein
MNWGGHNGWNGFLGVDWAPGREVEGRRDGTHGWWGDGVTVEEVGHEDEVAGLGEGVGEDSVVDELDAEDVG